MKNDKQFTFSFHWFEAKQLDRVTNFSTETEVLKNLLRRDVDAHYYCSFSKKKTYYDLEGSIHYLGILREKHLKYFEFNLLVILYSAFLALRKKRQIIMTNQNLASRMFLARFVSFLLRRHHVFTVDIRTLPIVKEETDPALNKYYADFSSAGKHCDGFSFITPFIGEVTYRRFPKIKEKPTVFWSSGVDMDLFCAKKYNYKRVTDRFRVFYHGGLAVDRGILALIQACEQLDKEGLPIELVLIGIEVDKQLSHYIAENKLERFCSLSKPVPLKDIPQAIASCDLAVMPFPYYLIWRTSSPIKLMEYMAMGKPILVPDQECFTDVFNGSAQNNVTFYDAKAEDQLSELTTALRNLIRAWKPQDKTPCMHELISFVEKEYTWAKQAEKIKQWGIELLQGSK